LLGGEGFDAEDRLHGIGLAVKRDGRIDLLPPIRDHVVLFHKLDDADAAAVAEHFLMLTQQLGPLIGAAGGAEAAPRLRDELENIEAAFRLMLKLDRREDAMRALMGFRRLTRMFDIWTTIYLDLAASCQSDDDVFGEADCTMEFGYIAQQRGSWEITRASYKKATLLYRRAGSLIDEAGSIQSLGDLAYARRDNEGACAAYQEARLLYRQAGFVFGEASCAQGFGNIQLDRSDHDGARAAYGEALSLSRGIGDLMGEARSLEGMGDVARECADYDGARAGYEEASQLYRQIGDVWHESICIENLARCQSAEKELSGA